MLAATAVSALKYVLSTEVTKAQGEIVDPAFAVVVIVIPSILIVVIFLLFILTFYRVSEFSIDSLKISLGFLETAFMIFISTISDRLFGHPGRDRSIKAGSN